MKKAAVAVLLVFAACGDSSLGGVQVGFRVEAELLDFGRALKGSQVERALKLTATGRADVEVEVATDAPFSAPATVTIPGGGEAAVEVVFTAPASSAEGTLRLSANGKRLDVQLRGVGVEPLPCTPSAQCRLSRFVLETKSCAEEVAPNGTPCTPSSVCLEAGVCVGGACEGSPRTCNDNNPCTVDACGEQVGCVYRDTDCPAPANPCRVPYCDPKTGCGDAPVSDWTPCGAFNCATGLFCLSGACVTSPTPEDFLCAPKSPCQGEGRCKAQQCVRPDAGEATPSFTVLLPGAPVVDPSAPALVAAGGNLYLSVCAADGGCQLTSYTGSGFERFTAPLGVDGGGGARAVVTSSDAGLLALADDALESYAPENGALRWRLDFASLPAPLDGGHPAPHVSRESIAVAHDGTAHLLIAWASPDAGSFSSTQTWLRVAPDGGVLSTTDLPWGATPSALALDFLGDGVLYDADGGALAALRFSDGGADLPPLGDGPGVRQLAVTAERLWSGGRFLRALDGGLIASLPLEEAEPFHGIMTSQAGYAFDRACVSPATPPCAPTGQALHAVSFSPVDGGVFWRAPLGPAGEPLMLVEEALVPFAQPGAALAAVVQPLDGGARVVALASGQTVFQCPVAEGAQVLGATFDKGHLYLLVDRPEGAKLEAYELGGFSISNSGWPLRYGVAGARRAAP